MAVAAGSGDAPDDRLPTKAQDAKILAEQSGCLKCHAIDKKVIGRAYCDIAAKYKSDSRATVN